MEPEQPTLSDFEKEWSEAVDPSDIQNWAWVHEESEEEEPEVDERYRCNCNFFPPEDSPLCQARFEQCYWCAKPGHYARICPNRESVPCYHCQGMGHEAQDCPVPLNSD